MIALDSKILDERKVEEKTDFEKIYDKILLTLAESPRQILNFPLTSQENFIINYASRMRELERILGATGTREVCKTCKVTCCYKSFPETENKDFPMFSELQEIEAKRNGLIKDLNRGCKFNSDKGCKLDLLKPPICIKYICPDIFHQLYERFGEERTNSFGQHWNPLGKLNQDTIIAKQETEIESCQIRIIFSMSHSIQAGKYLIGEISKSEFKEIVRNYDTLKIYDAEEGTNTIITSPEEKISGIIECNCIHGLRIKDHPCTYVMKNGLTIFSQIS